MASTVIFQHEVGTPFKTITRGRYRSLLADRVAWLMDRENDPRDARRWLRTEMEAAGYYHGPATFEDSQDAAHNMITGNPYFLDMFRQVVSLPSSPWPLRRIQAAVDAIFGSSLADWIDAAIPALSRE